MRANYEVYDLAVQNYLSRDLKSFKRLMGDKSLSQPERLLLKAREHFLNQKMEHAYSFLKDSEGFETDFLEAERKFLLANYHSYKSDWHKSLQCNLDAVFLYERVSDPAGLFVCNYNLSVDYGNFGDRYNATKRLRYAEKYSRNGRERSLVLRANACFASVDGEFSKAIEYIESALENVGALSENDLRTTQLVRADLLICVGRLEDAYSQLEQIKRTKGVRNRVKLYFDLLTLKFIISGELEFSRFTYLFCDSREYRLKWGVITNIACGDLDQAQSCWDELKVIFPYKDGYKQDMFAFDQRTSFGRCLNALKTRRNSVQSVANTAADQRFVKSKIDNLVDVLRDAPFPMRKEILIQKVWKTDYNPRFDNRLYKLIERARDRGFEIESKRRAYYLK